MTSRRLSQFAAVVAVLAPLAVSAQTQTTVVVRKPVFTSVYGDPRYSDPVAVDTWMARNVGGANASIAMGSLPWYPHSGDGSVSFGMEQYSGSSGKADIEYFFGGQYLSPFTLGSLQGASYDFYRNSISTVAANQNPAFRFYVDADGSAETADDRGFLIYEPVYNGNAAPAQDVWQTEAINAASNVWFRQFTPGVSDYTASGIGAPLSTFQSYLAPNGAQFSANSLIYGLSAGIGSGWTAGNSWYGAIDNLSVTVNGHQTTFNFESSKNNEPPTTTTPEPATLALVGGGLLALGAGARRRRKQS